MKSVKTRSRVFWPVAFVLIISCTKTTTTTQMETNKDTKGAFAWLLPVITAVGLSGCGKKATSSIDTTQFPAASTKCGNSSCVQ